MREMQIKKALAEHLVREAAANRDGFLEELRLHGGQIRADLVHVELMHCYEIKSEADSLARLINQGARYARFFDRVTLVMAQRHVAKAMPLLPPWWGAMVLDSETRTFTSIRPAGVNFHQSANALTSVLTRDEALQILEEAGEAKGLRSKSLYLLQEHIAQLMPMGQIKEQIRNALLVRAEKIADLH